MWGSSDESDDPKPASVGRSNGAKSKTTMDSLRLKLTAASNYATSYSSKPASVKVRPSSFGVGGSDVSKPASVKVRPSSFGVGGSDDSQDSDSSSGSDVKKASNPSGARAALGSQAPKPKPRSSLLGSDVGGPAGRQSDPANKIRAAGLAARNQPDVRLKVQQGASAHQLRGGVPETSTGSRAKAASSTNASSSAHAGPRPSSSKAELSLKSLSAARSQSNVPEVDYAFPEKPRSFEKLRVKPTDTDRGLQYSRRDEKPNLSEFLPAGLQKKQKESEGAKPRSAYSSSKAGTRVEGAMGTSGFLRDMDEIRQMAAALKLDDGGNRGGAGAASAGSRSSRSVAGPPANPTRTTGAATGTGPGPEKARPQNRRPHRDDSSSADDSDDESLEMLLPATQRYVPPPRRPGGQGRPPPGARDEFPPLGGRHNGAARPERQRRPNADEGVWARGQRPGQDRNNGDGPYGRHFGARGGEDERNFGRNRRERDDDEDGIRNNRRGNRDERNPRHPYNNGNNNNDQGFEGRRGEGRRNDGDNRQRYAPPPRQGNEGDEDAQRGPGRQRQGPDRGGDNRQYNRPRADGFRPQEVNMSFTRLRDLKSKDPAEVVAALSYSKEGLSRLLKNEGKLNTDSQMMRLLLTCLGKACQCHSMPAQQSEILNIVRTSGFLKILGTYLTTSSLTAQAMEVTGIIGESADLLRTLITLFPSVIHDVVMVHAFLEVAKKQAELRGVGHLPPDVAKKVEDFEIAKDAAMEVLQRKETRQKGGVVDEDSLTPPDDFRQMSVFPTMEDLDKEELPFLRKNKALGGYTGVDHYLDVQFRLLREDFVYPLREGIAAYLSMVAGPRRGRQLKDIRVYHDVHILRAVCLTSGLGHRLTFDVSRMKRVRWEVSKRLIFGSLVCLSADNFRTLYFATVSNREPSDLKEGVVEVTFEHNQQEVSAIPPETMFTMAETTAFFEAYRHVLSGLQRIRDNDLPFQKYIVRCDKNVSEPSYLRNSNKTYDLRPVVDESVKLREDRQLLEQDREVAYRFSAESQPADDIPVLEREDWPDPRLLKLDASQYEAMYRALTKEFSIIQGPPGTGKTYVGLKIVKALLHNRKAWDPQLDSCMLIVCYTNHALDQFLEGVVSFFSGRVVRVGSRLRSEKLEAYSLSNLRWNMRRNRDEVDRDFREITRLRFQGHEAMDKLKADVDTMGLQIESARREILHEEVLMPFMLNRHYERLQDIRPYMEHGQFVQQGRTKKKVFLIPEWLGIGAVLQNTHVTAEDLQMLDHELGEDELEIEGEIQALEEQNRLDTDSTGNHNDRKRREKEKKRALAQERSSYLAVDISTLDRGHDDEAQGGQGGRQGDGGGGGFQIPKAQWRKLKRKLRRNVESDDRMTEAEERAVGDIWMLDLNQRWRLFRRWTHNLCVSLLGEMRERERLYDELARRQQETLMQEDKHILKTATVIAMTTTAAARYQSVLQEVKPRVVVVEEAAEVLEGHVITTLSQDCKHLILIGDHKQLRPNPTVYALARKYNLELSLFERMINNGLKCVTLGWQHRMRPEIAALVKPIYPDLQNHPSVEKYEPIKGVSSNLFFISHSQPEAHDDETKSHSNLYEAQYLAQLCQYLLKQGYDASRITVLTTYSGQLFQLRKLMPKKSIFDGVRVTVVDNFQGEENDIILLSLVRSNEDGNIGFLKIENRVCVALSRAKMGLYVIGNFDLLNAESNLWQTITTGLRKQGQIGEALNLYCQNHPNDGGLVIRTPDDFYQAPEGGCMKPCTARLDCGHVCTRMCHPYDKEHKDYQCLKKCERKMACEFQHTCKKLCYQPCGECVELVKKRMPKCGHEQWMKCSIRPEEFTCQEECKRLLLCGHRCGDVCGERHQCFEKVEHTWPCGHKGTVRCSEKDTATCTQRCGQQLSCGHACAGTCSECHGGRLHKRCRNNCTKILVCGHSCKDTCSNCPPCESRCENSCVHSYCRKRCGLPCTPCKERCAWRCPHHRCSRLCSEPCDRPMCDEPCPKLLKCDHPCIGLCGEPCPKLCRICDNEKVTEIFFGTEDVPDARFVQLEDCEHAIEVSSLDQWMSTTTDQHEDSVQLKACPICKTTIRRNLRYGAIIKTQLSDIENVKDKIRGSEAQIEHMVAEVELLLHHETDPTYEEMKTDILEAGDNNTLGGLFAVKNQFKLLDETKKLRQLRRKKLISTASFPEALGRFEKWICAPRLVFSDQETHDAETELLRLKHWLMLIHYQSLAVRKGITLPSRVSDPMANMIRRMKQGLLYHESHQDNTKELLEQLEKLIPESGLGISEQERDMIVKAMQLNQGHWFKCPKGHIYAIGDCGGATEESRCPECNAVIGGTSHRLRDDNALAPEMDGARHAAWSEQVNLANFRLNDLL